MMTNIVYIRLYSFIPQGVFGASSVDGDGDYSAYGKHNGGELGG